MAAPMVAAQAGQQAGELAKEVAHQVKIQTDAFANDPMLYSGRVARKWGLVSLGGGIASFILWQVGKKVDQSYLNDITNVLGLPQQAPPTQGSSAAPQGSPAPPPVPPQITFLNQIVFDINSLGTTNTSANVALLQDLLKQLLGIASLVYSTGGSDLTPGPGVGSSLNIAIMQTVTLIYHMEGIPIPSNPSWTWGYWAGQGNVNPLTDRFFTELTALGFGGFSQQGPADWNDALSMVSNTVNNDNFKITINSLASSLNASQPFDVTVKSSNSWGVLGTIASDLSAVGAAIEQGASVAVNDLSTFGKDVVGIVSDIPSAIALIGKVLINLPRLGFDAVGYSFWWAVDMVASAIWVPLLVIGGALMAWSIFALNVYPRIETRLKLVGAARTAKFLNWFDARFGIPAKAQEVWQEKSTEGMLAAAAAPLEFVPSTVPLPSPPVPLPGPRGRARHLKPGESPIVGQESDAEKAPPEPPAKPGDVPSPPSPPSQSPPPEPGVPTPPVEATPTTETEDLLGQSPNLREQKMRLEHPSAPPDIEAVPSAEAQQTEGTPAGGAGSTPPITSPVPERPGEVVPTPVPVAAPISPENVAQPGQFSSPSITLVRTPTYREAKAERDRRMSKRMLEQVGAAFTIPTNATDARDEADRRTAIIKQAQAERRALKSAADTMNKKPVSERRYRGFMETANEGLYPERYGD